MGEGAEFQKSLIFRRRRRRGNSTSDVEHSQSNKAPATSISSPPATATQPVTGQGQSITATVVTPIPPSQPHAPIRIPTSSGTSVSAHMVRGPVHLDKYRFIHWPTRRAWGNGTRIHHVPPSSFKT